MSKPLTLYLVPLMTTLETGFADPGFEAYSTEDIDEQIRNNPYSGRMHLLAYASLES